LALRFLFGPGSLTDYNEFAAGLEDAGDKRLFGKGTKFTVGVF
jgi:hypothetical protein